MTYVTCTDCGRRAHKNDGMIVTYRGHAYCHDGKACERRQTEREREMPSMAVRKKAVA